MPFLGEIAALSAALLWSFTAFIFSAVQAKIGAVMLNIIRCALAAVYLGATILVFQIEFNPSILQVVYLSLSGIIGLIIGDSFLFKSYSFVGPRIGMLVHSSNPIMAALLAFIFFSESLTFLSVIGIFITLAGISLVIIQRDNSSDVKNKTANGVIFAFIGALGQAVGLIFVKLAFIDGEIHSLSATFIRMISSFVIFLPIGLFTKRFSNPALNLFRDKKLLRLIFIGSVIGPFLGITLSIVSIEYAKIGVASTIMSTVPIIMLPLSHFINKEKLSWKSIWGAVVAVAGITLLFVA
jgi:drug/metabolite transporter (DMT)-like permease